MSLQRHMVGLAIGTAVLAVVLAALNLVHGNLNQDEGWYLYAAKMVHAGKTPYADFAFTQGPVLPLVYSVFSPVVEKWGVAGGRLVTTLFGLLAGMLATATAWRIADRNKTATALAVLLLVTCNVYQSYFTTIVKTYALCSFFLMAGFFALSLRYRAGALIAGVLLALAAGTRLSVGIVLPIVGIWLLFQRERRLDWLWFGIGGGVTLLAVFLPAFIHSSEQIVFGLFGYHAGRDPGGFGMMMVLKAGFVSRFVQAYYLFSALTLVALCFGRKYWTGSASVLLLWICGAGITAVHLYAAFPYDDYQVVAYPVLAVALALTLLPRLDEKWSVPALSFLLLASVAAAFSSPINQDWFVRGQDRVWWNFKGKTDLALLREAADLVRANSPEGSTLLTQDTYLAVESGRAVPPGMEMGPFSYYPDLSREQAEKLHLVNKEMLLETLAESDAPLAAFSGYGLSIESPSISELPFEERDAFLSIVQDRYETIATIPFFGQAHTTLTIYRMNNE